jgi:hypothetical protein
MTKDQLIEKWTEDLAVNIQNEKFNAKNGEYFTAVKYKLRAELIREFLFDLKTIS